MLIVSAILLAMVEVFKTNVVEADHAKMLITQIHRTFSHYKVTFDLADCDNILRVKSASGFIQTTQLIKLVKDLGFDAEVLPDDLPLCVTDIRVCKGDR
ncbi:MAG: hypothetical protein M3040_15130 [Bacteroidota bacterium]|nr:hypothetical protein [Bacteroidota bacterium]